MRQLDFATFHAWATRWSACELPCHWVAAEPVPVPEYADHVKRRVLEGMLDGD
jgi:hypothetical protein